jgi:hypothetical protein
LTVDPTYDTPSGDEVLQEDVEEPVVDVKVNNVVRTDEMPTKLGGMGFHVILTGARAVKVLEQDPRRKRCVMWALGIAAGCEVIVLSPTEHECNAFQGALLWPGTGLLRYEWTCQEELWARGADIQSTGGTYSGLVISTDDGLLSYVNEQWAN